MYELTRRGYIQTFGARTEWPSYEYMAVAPPIIVCKQPKLSYILYYYTIFSLIGVFYFLIFPVWTGTGLPSTGKRLTP